MQFVRLALRGGTQFGVSHGDRPEAGNRRDQRLLLGGEDSDVSRIDEDRALGARSAEGRGNQHSRRDQAAERVQLAADGDGNSLSGGNRALRQIGGEANGLAVMSSPEGICQLGSFGGHGAQFEGSLAAQKNRDQTRTQQKPETIRQGLDDGGYVGSSVQGGRDLGEDLGPPMFLARGFAEPGCFQQAAELPGQDSGLGGEVLIKKSLFGVVQKRRRADDFIEDHQRSGHQGAGLKLARRGEGRARRHLIDEDRAAPAHGFCRDGALLGQQPEADEPLGELAVGLFSNELVTRVTTPEINAANLEELAAGAAKELD